MSKRNRFGIGDFPGLEVPGSHDQALPGLNCVGNSLDISGRFRAQCLKGTSTCEPRTEVRGVAEPSSHSAIGCLLPAKSYFFSTTSKVVQLI